MSKYKLFFISLVLILIIAHTACAQFGTAENVVSSKMLLSVDRLRPGDSFELAVSATVKNGYHIGSHDKDSLYPTKLTLSGPKGVTFSEPVYSKGKRISFCGQSVPVYEGTFVIEVKGRVAKDAKPARVTLLARLDSQACKGDQCYPPQVVESSLKVDIAARGEKVEKINQDVFGSSVSSTSAGGAASDIARKLAAVPLFARLLMLYGFGLLLAFTPCVYPMVPVTVGYFSTQTDSRHTKRVVLLAAMYVLGLALTYSVIGAVASTAGGMFGAAMQSPSVIIGIAALLVVLALSMFGLYELRAPSFIQSRASGKSGVLGALFMGLVFGIVAAPCVGPAVLGLMVYVASIGSPLVGFMLFFVLALGIGTPLFFLATFSAKMPVPGVWMVAVKKIAGFLLIGAAAYFIQPIVPEGIARYLIPAVLVAAGVHFAFFEKSIHSHALGASCGKVSGLAVLVFAVIMVAPHGKKESLKWQPYRSDSIAIAVKSGKPSMVDFTADWCVVCKELEHGPFSDPNIIEAARRFARFRVDGTDRKDAKMLAAVKKYRVMGFPTVIFFDSSGKEVTSARVVGFADSKEMLKRMGTVK